MFICETQRPSEKRLFQKTFSRGHLKSFLSPSLHLWALFFSFLGPFGQSERRRLNQNGRERKKIFHSPISSEEEEKSILCCRKIKESIIRGVQFSCFPPFFIHLQMCLCREKVCHSKTFSARFCPNFDVFCLSREKAKFVRIIFFRLRYWPEKLTTAEKFSRKGIF